MFNRWDGAARIFSYHLMQLPRFELTPVELHRRMHYQLIYRATATTILFFYKKYFKNFTAKSSVYRVQIFMTADRVRCRSLCRSSLSAPTFSTNRATRWKITPSTFHHQTLSWNLIRCHLWQGARFRVEVSLIKWISIFGGILRISYKFLLWCAHCCPKTIFISILTQLSPFLSWVRLQLTDVRTAGSLVKFLNGARIEPGTFQYRADWANH